MTSESFAHKSCQLVNETERERCRQIYRGRDGREESEGEEGTREKVNGRRSEEEDTARSQHQCRISAGAGGEGGPVKGLAW